VSKTFFIYGTSAVLHGVLALTVASLDKPVRHDTVAISMSESKKKKAPDPPKPAELPKSADDAPKAAAPHHEARAKAATAEAKPAAAPVNAPGQQAGMEGLPDFGLSLGNGGPGGFAVPAGGGGAPAPGATPHAETPRAARVLTAKPEDTGCAEALVKPKAKSTSQPGYSAAARDANVEGSVRVEVTVDETGHVVSARVLAGLGYGLDELSLEAAKRATFEAATKCGKAVRATVVLRMHFQQP
jgi:protein TonB